MCCKFGFGVKEKLYEYQPEVVIENGSYKISVQTDHLIEAQTPNLMVIDKNSKCQIIDFSVPYDTIVNTKRKISGSD